MSPEDAIRSLRAGIDAVAAIDPADLVTADASGELLEDLHRQFRRLERERHRLLRSFEARGDHEALGYRTAKQWCCDRLRTSSSRAGADLKLARQLAAMPTVDERWAAGDLGAEHVRAVASARTDATRDAFDEWESWLAEQAAILDHRGLRKVVDRWKLKVDPDPDEPVRQVRDRDAHVSATFQGAVVVDSVLDAVRGSMFKTVFDRICNELFEADWAAARERLGREPNMLDLDRTPAQRRADTLVEMATRAEMAMTPMHRRPRPLVTVVAGLDALAGGIAELWNETPITARQLAEILADDPDIERYVYGSDEQPIAFNPRHRFYTGKLRRAIQVRDRRCTGAGCDLPAEWCDVDHIDPVQEGGETTPTNGRVACSPDNRSRPRRRFRSGRAPARGP